MSGHGQIELRRRLAAPVEEVFRWWTDAECLQQWMTPAGSVEAQIDPRIGGSLRIVMRSDQTSIEHAGDFIEIDPPRRVVFTLSSPYTGSSPSVVTVELEPDGESATQLRLVHSLLPDSTATSHRDGWNTMLGRLGGLIARDEGPVVSSPGGGL